MDGVPLSTRLIVRLYIFTLFYCLKAYYCVKNIFHSQHKLVISSQAGYVRKIHESIANTRTKILHNQKQCNKLLAQSQYHE